MNFEVKATKDFEKSLKALSKRYKSIKADYATLLDSLEANPFQGVELSPGIRKIRIPITSKGKGKSGGARVITYTVIISECNGVVHLMDIYDKSEHSTVDINIIKENIKKHGL